MPQRRRSPAPITLLGALVLLSFLVLLLGAAGCLQDNPDRTLLLQTIARWEDRRLAPEDSLRAMISHEDAHVRLAAVRAAGLIGRDFIDEALVGALQDRSLTIRRQACFALGLLGSPPAVDALVEAAADPRAEIRLAALRGLAHVDGGTEALLAAASDGNPAEAAAAWDAIRNQADGTDRTALLQTIQGGLTRAEPDVQWRILRCAEAAADSTLIPVIVPFLDSPRTQVRVHALRALARQGRPEALDAVLDWAADRGRLKGRDRDRTDIALFRALGALSGGALETEDQEQSRAQALAGHLIRGAEADSPFVAETALQAMAACVEGLALPSEAAEQESLLPVWRIRMARAARDRLASPHVAVRAASFSAWAALRGPGCAKDLARLTGQETVPFVQAAGVQALGRIHPDPMTTLFSYSWEKRPAWWDQDAGPTSAPVLVRSTALGTLAEAARERPEVSVGRGPLGFDALVRDQLIRSTSSEDFVVAATAAGLLAGFPHPDAVSALAERWQSADGEGRFEVRRGILTGLSAMFAVEADSATAGDPTMAGVRPTAAGVLRQAFDSTDLRIRLEGRQAAVQTQLLPENLIPSEASLRATLPAARRSDDQPPTAVPFDAPDVQVVTDKGTFTISLDGQLAPNTCAVFLDLIGRGYFNDLGFHRVVPDFVVQGGDPRGDGWGGPGYMIRSEWSATPYTRGRVGIAHDGKDTGGSQFFVTLSEQPHLVGRYTIFGEVTSGMDVVDRLEVGDRFAMETVP